jgi:hypothetical protein
LKNGASSSSHDKAAFDHVSYAPLGRFWMQMAWRKSHPVDAPAVEILSESSYRMHKLTPFARAEGTHITYPPEQSTLLL